jgi:phage tail sheath protein FI
MPIAPTYPGVYVEEIPSGVRTITGVSTSVTAFVGRARRGPVNKATTLYNFSDYERTFGLLWSESSMGYAVRQYFLNGGKTAVIVRVHRPDGGDNVATLTFAPDGGGANIVFAAASPGAWGSELRARVNHDTKDPSDTNLFNFRVKDLDTGVEENHRNVSVETGHPRHITKVLEEDSKLVRVRTIANIRPAETPAPSGKATDFEDVNGDLSHAIVATTVTNGGTLTQSEVEGSGSADPKTGIHALDEVDIVNLICIPPYLPNSDGDVVNGDIDAALRSPVLTYAIERRAMFIVDPPQSWDEKGDPIDGAAGIDSAAFAMSRDPNAALYFPRIKFADPLQENRLVTGVPCGVIAGVMARTDAQRGVWKAPAGIEATLRGVPDLQLNLTDQENGALNPKGVNCLRIFSGVGRVSWGARTTHGDDVLASEWKYVPVRRFALFLEESLFRGTKWVVFEPNDEPLWAQIRLNVGAFMHNLFRQGAFQGSSPREAYLVKCDKETTTQTDINSGIVNIIVGFAPLKPAEFVILKIQQLAGQVEA